MEHDNSKAKDSEVVCDLRFIRGERRLRGYVHTRFAAVDYLIRLKKDIPTIAPTYRMNCGHNRPSWKQRTVPATAPTAARIVVPFARLSASNRYALSLGTFISHSVITIIRGRATPMTAKMM
jgi:hypothetical protein